ncbi:MAG: hypothetical protein WAM25_15280, partial [Candidatus Acidiferrales bacterium]
MSANEIRRRAVTSLMVLGLLFRPAPSSEAKYHKSEEQMTDKPSSLTSIQQYISQGWDHLTRSLLDCRTYEDVKTKDEP